MKYLNKKVAAAVAVAVVAVLVALGVPNTDKIQKLLDAVVQFVPEKAPEAPVPAPAADAGAPVAE